jgi:hypothetical protein
MRTSTIGVLATLVLAIPGLGEAQSSSKLAIGTIRGDASRVRRQILLQLCESYQCVAASRVTTDSRPDPQKLQRAGVLGYLGGAVTGEPGERRLFLSLTTPTSTARKPARTWRLRLTPDGRLRPQALERFSMEIDEQLQGAAARPPPSAAAPPQRPQPPPPPHTAKPPPPKPPPTAETTPPPPPPKAASPARAAETPKPRPAEAPHRAAPYHGPLRAAGEVGLWITNRKLSYSGVNNVGATTPLRTYDASAIFVPSLRAEVYPGAFMSANPMVAGIGMYAEYGHSIGLKVKPPSGTSGGNRSGALTTFDVGAVWRLQPISGSRFVIAPALGYRSLQVTTGGAKIDGLPDTRPSGFELRLDTEVPAGRALTILGGGGYTLWTSKKDLVGSDFFEKGSARGFELEAGAAYRFYGPLSAKAMFEYQSISYTGLKDPQTAGLGSASGAKDSYMGLRLMLRAEF